MRMRDVSGWKLRIGQAMLVQFSPELAAMQQAQADLRVAGKLTPTYAFAGNGFALLGG